MSSPDVIAVHDPMPDDVRHHANDRKLGWLFWLSVGWVALTIALSIIANLLPLPNPNVQNYSAINSAPSWAHLLGTDDLGRDILSRVIYGSRVSLIVGFGAILIGLAIGGTLGMISAYRRGMTDTLLNAASYLLLAFPALLAVMAIVTFWGHALWKITVIVGIASSPLTFRIVRAATLSISSRDFVTAARAQGATDARVLFREILPNILPLIISFSLLGVAAVIVLEGSLAFLGLSVPVSTPSWGNMLNEGRSYLQVNPWLTIFPATAMFLFLLALNYIGDGLRQYFDVTELKL